VASVSEQFSGTWLLESWTAQDEFGHVERQFGDQPRGVLIITPDGWLSMQLAASSRADLASGSGPLGGPAEHSAAFLTYAAYVGRCRVEGDRLTTTVQVGLIPGWVGSEQVRGVVLDDGLLVLRARPRRARQPGIRAGQLVLPATGREMGQARVA